MRAAGAVLLFAVYVLYTGDPTPTRLALGAFFALIAATAGLPSGRTQWSRIPTAVAAAPVLLASIVGETLRAGFRVAGLAFHPRPRLSPGIVTLPMKGPSLDRAVAAHTITLTPGELVLDDDGSVLTLHTLQVGDPAETKAALDRRLMLWARVTAPWRDE